MVPISLSARRHAERLFPAPGDLMKRLGHQVQFTHRAERAACSFPGIIEQEGTTDLWDFRSEDGLFLYDDKVCTFYKDGKLTDRRSDSHTVSFDEYLRFNRHVKEMNALDLLGDVLIASWDYTDQQHDTVVFRGFLSWRGATGYVTFNHDTPSGSFTVTSSRRFNTVPD